MNINGTHISNVYNASPATLTLSLLPSDFGGISKQPFWLTGSTPITFTHVCIVTARSKTRNAFSSTSEVPTKGWFTLAHSEARTNTRKKAVYTGAHTPRLRVCKVRTQPCGKSVFEACQGCSLVYCSDGLHTSYLLVMARKRNRLLLRMCLILLYQHLKQKSKRRYWVHHFLQRISHRTGMAFSITHRRCRRTAYIQAKLMQCRRARGLWWWIVSSFHDPRAHMQI